jgi:flagellar motor protein MotB
MANDFSDPDLLAMGVRQRKFPLTGVLLLLLLIGTGGFVAGMYLPLQKAHQELAGKFEALAKSSRSVTDELTRTQEQLKTVEQERSKLQSAVSASDERNKGVEQRSNDLSHKLEAALEKRIKQQTASLAQADNTVSVRIPSAVLFAANGVGVTRTGAQLLCEVAKAMPTSEVTLTVAVHAAGAEVSAALAKTYKTAWDVTAAQAAAAAQVLTKQCGVPAAHLAASAHGDSRPMEGVDAAGNSRAELSVDL